MTDALEPASEGESDAGSTCTCRDVSLALDVTPGAREIEVDPDCPIHGFRPAPEGDGDREERAEPRRWTLRPFPRGTHAHKVIVKDGPFVDADIEVVEASELARVKAERDEARERTPWKSSYFWMRDQRDDALARVEALSTERDRYRDALLVVRDTDLPTERAQRLARAALETALETAPELHPEGEGEETRS